MLFNSFAYLVFLPIVFLCYWLVFDYAMRRCKRQLLWQNLFVVVASYVFYGWWDWRFLILIAITTVLSFLSGLGIDKAPSPRAKKAVMLSNVIANLGILGVYKYYDFFAAQFADLFGLKADFLLLHLILPVGISFYTFQALSYSIDVYRKHIEPTRDIVAFTAFLSFFPQLVAGPIERATNLLPQFQKRRTFDYTQVVDGMRQILWGLLKKVVIADNCAPYVDEVFGHLSSYSGSTLLLATLLFSLQIYGDFSGYSDIAIGTAKLFGIKLMRNFNMPYFSRDIAEFWRRWHISLTTWFRDYVYIPLGGSRPTIPGWLQCKVDSVKCKGTDNEFKGERLKVIGEETGKADTPASTLYTLHHTQTEASTPYTLHPTPKMINRYTKAIAVRNTFIIFLLSGFWHGANWTFVLWGVYHALLFVPLLLLNQNRRYRDVVATVSSADSSVIHKRLPSLKELGQISLTFVLVMMGWAIFRVENLSQLGVYLANLLDPSLWSLPCHLKAYDGLALPLGLSIVLMGVMEWVNRTREHALAHLPSSRVLRILIYYLLLVLMYLYTGYNETFIYFQF